MSNSVFQFILGQPYAVNVLQNALDDGRLAGSYLFVGPDGVGKTTDGPPVRQGPVRRVLGRRPSRPRH